MWAGTHVGFHLNWLLLLSDYKQNLIVIYKLINHPSMKFHENMLEWFWNHYVNRDELIIIIIIYLTANGLSPGGNGYNACTGI